MSEEVIKDFITNAQEENVWIDFKRISSSDFSVKDDRKNLAIAISGFANSNGGLIVWGVDARKNSEGIDCATSIVPINGIKGIISALTRYSAEATSPTLELVKHKVIDFGDNSGCAVTYVPENVGGPYMAKLGEDRYYKRSGDRFYKMEHFDLEDMFGRRQKPKLSLTRRITGFRENAQIVIGISNYGKGVAKAPYLAFKVNNGFTPSFYGIDGNRNEGMRKVQFSGSEFPHRYGEHSGFVIHPGTSIEVCLLSLGLTPSSGRAPKEDIEIEFEITAEGISMQRGVMVIPLMEFGG